MDFKNRLTGKSSHSEDTFFFVYDYWTYDEGSNSFRSVTDGSEMPEKLFKRLTEL